MAATLSAVPLYVRSKVKLYFGENSLLSQAVNVPRSFVNMALVYPFKNSPATQAYGYTAWIWSKIWRFGSWPFYTIKSPSKEMVDSEENMSESEDGTELRDMAATNISSSTIRELYLYFLENNFLGITKESLELLRYDSKFLQGVQDLELRSVLQSLFGCLPKDCLPKDETSELESGTNDFPSAKQLFWTASTVVWRSLLNRVVYIPFISWILPENKNVLDQKETITEDLIEISNGTEGSHSTNTSNTTTTVTSLLMCEAGHFTQVISDSGTYAISTTHDLLNEAVLLFVPMEILENTTELLKTSSLSMTVSPLSAFWQLFNYVSIWGLDLVDDMCSQPEINYAIIDDDDFHFVVNVPKMRRPILFVGIR